MKTNQYLYGNAQIINTYGIFYILFLLFQMINLLESIISYLQILAKEDAKDSVCLTFSLY
jgi:hypothetical protein